MNRSNTSVIALSMSGRDLTTKKLMSDEVFRIAQWILFTVVCQLINIFGTGTNIINIICFIKQGFKDSVNISLMALSISDMVGLITLIWTNICYTPPFVEADLPFDPMEVTYASVGMVHISFSRISCWITAFITLERCLCITMPLKVKAMITPERTSYIIVCIFILIISSSVPVFTVIGLGLKVFPHKNKTMIGLIYTGDHEKVEKISFIVNNMVVSFLAFIVITTCTVILVIKLYSKSKWLMKSTQHSQANSVSTRNQSVAKMVMIISIIFIACFVPLSVMFLVMSMEPSFSFYGNNRNMLIFIGGLGLALESVNSSVNIFVYYSMSSRYRDVFRQLFLISNK